MPIPKAAPNDVFAMYFKYAVFIKKGSQCAVFADTYRYDPETPLVMDAKSVWMSKEELCRLYAPHLTIEDHKETLCVTYEAPDLPRRSYRVNKDQVTLSTAPAMVDVPALMEPLGKKVWKGSDYMVVSIDAKEDDPVPFANFSSQKFYYNLLDIKDRGELNYAIWYEPANRLIPYRMYIPFTYTPSAPMKTVVCFHGGDANCDYMFHHTNYKIEQFAEKRGYILLAVTSYRKYTFFGASRFPTGGESFDPEKENPLDLTEEEWRNCLIAEKSVMVQIEDAAKRYNLDFEHLYALGNSGGCLGIFRQVQYIGKPFFRAVVCSGGVPAPGALDFEIIRNTKTSFLLLMSSEDIFDGQFTGHVAMPIFLENKMDVTLSVVGGGLHLTGWSHALPEIFDFFDSHR